GKAMTHPEMSKQKKALHTLAMVNAGIWAMALVALTILLQKGGNLKGMFVILAGGTAVAIQLISLISRTEQ
ncbi:MAG TPA: hypothetical protein VLL07_04050, partial [Pontiella sp.]|nr:hypothetical protein [Pontiella sp.]